MKNGNWNIIEPPTRYVAVLYWNKCVFLCEGKKYRESYLALAIYNRNCSLENQVDLISQIQIKVIIEKYIAK